MSKTRQGDEHLIARSYAVTHPPDLGITRRSYPHWDQLAYAAQGVMTVATGQSRWVVPPHRAVWIPAGVAHAVEMSGRVRVRTLFFRPRLSRRSSRGCVAVNVTPLLRELILHASRRNTLKRDDPSDRRLAQIILEQLDALPAAPLQLPLPRDARARAAAGLLPGPLDPRASGASRRTLERLFLRDTGMTLGRWRRRQRLVEAVRLLAAGQAVTSVALDVGYQSPSSFVAAFRRELGTTPGRYFKQAG